MKKTFKRVLAVVASLALLATATPAMAEEAPANAGTIMWLSNLQSGVQYDSTVDYMTAICDELGYNFTVVYGDGFNDAAGNLQAVKNAMTDDVVGIMVSQDGGLATIMEEFRHKKKDLLLGSEKRWLTKIAKKANAEIFDRAEHDPACRGMGTTLVAALISDHRLISVCIGDSRCYMLKEKNHIEQLTEDQTYVHYLVSTGKITEEEAMSHPDRHVIMNALGIYPALSLSIQEYEYNGESVLCCSDGLYNQVPVDEIANILSTDERCDQKVSSLIAVANHNGGSDNIAVALWETISHD